jgi:hypothetical protein
MNNILALHEILHDTKKKSMLGVVLNWISRKHMIRPTSAFYCIVRSSEVFVKLGAIVCKKCYKMVLSL